MARQAGARKGRGKPAAKPAAGAEDRLVDAALSLAERQGWRRTGLAEIAAEAGLPLAEAYAACPSKPALLAAFHRRIDRAALAGAGDGGEPPRDRLFDTLMRRFDVLAPHRRGVARHPAGQSGRPRGAAGGAGTAQFHGLDARVGGDFRYRLAGTHTGACTGRALPLAVPGVPGG